MEDDDIEIDINKILADAEEKSKQAAQDFDKAGDSITKKISLDENYSFSVYDFQGSFKVFHWVTFINESFQVKIGKASKIGKELKGKESLNCQKESVSRQIMT